MKTIDNRIKYYELLMNYDDTSKYINYELPEGYHYEFYDSFFSLNTFTSKIYDMKY